MVPYLFYLIFYRYYIVQLNFQNKCLLLKRVPLETPEAAVAAGRGAPVTGIGRGGDTGEIGGGGAGGHPRPGGVHHQ